jgi:hypothetical protein
MEESEKGEINNNVEAKEDERKSEEIEEESAL